MVALTVSILKSPRFLPFLTRSQINVVVARRVHYKDYFMIPKILQGLYLIQNLDTNYLPQKNKQKENKKKKRKRRKDFHTATTPNELNIEELMYRAKEWIGIAAARVSKCDARIIIK